MIYGAKRKEREEDSAVCYGPELKATASGMDKIIECNTQGWGEEFKCRLSVLRNRNLHFGYNEAVESQLNWNPNENEFYSAIQIFVHKLQSTAVRLESNFESQRPLT